jgi:hypothetical protein
VRKKKKGTFPGWLVQEEQSSVLGLLFFSSFSSCLLQLGPTEHSIVRRLACQSGECQSLAGGESGARSRLEGGASSRPPPPLGSCSRGASILPINPFNGRGNTTRWQAPDASFLIPFVVMNQLKVDPCQSVHHVLGQATGRRRKSSTRCSLWA